MDIEVSRSDLTSTRLTTPPARALEPGEVRLEIDSFGLTTNNITYAVFGDALSYWSFFPAGPGWGRIPVWGFATVVESRTDGIAQGRRYFGYFPMSNELVVQPGRVGLGGFTDVSGHRAAMASAYNAYVAVDADSKHRDDLEAIQMLLYPLFFTSWLIDDFLSDRDDFGAEQMVISSASSKTSMAAAFLAKARGDVTVVGLTSAGNIDFTQGLGVYDSVVLYDEIAVDGLQGLPVTSSVYVDVAGNADVLFAVHERLGDKLDYSMTVGGTHWDHEAAEHGALPGPTPTFFFAPNQITKRNQEWGADKLDAALSAAWLGFADWAANWLVLEERRGPMAIEATYLDLLAGKVDPLVGYCCTLKEEGP